MRSWPPPVNSGLFATLRLVHRRARARSDRAIGVMLGTVVATLVVASAAIAAPSTKKIDVKDFGARGDGTTDATAAINSAIAALPKTNGMLFFPCGAYLISGSLAPITADGTRIVGAREGKNCVTLKLMGEAPIKVLTIKGGGLGPKQNFAKEATRNSFTLVPGGMAAAGIVAGSYVLISDSAVASNGPNSPLISTQEVVKIASVSNDTARISGQFANTFPLRSDIPNRGGDPSAQVLRAPVSNVRIAHLTIDGSGHAGPSATALSLFYVVNSEVSDIAVSNLVEMPGQTDTLRFDTGYMNTIKKLSCFYCGNGTKSGGHSLNVDRQSYATIADITIVNTSQQFVFGFDTNGLNWSKLDNASIDQGGANGRPFKLLRSNHNTLNAVSVKNGAGNHNGISVTDMSTYNTFNKCSAVGNTGNGIAVFGNWNVYNTFNGCTSMYNTGAAFATGRDAFNNFEDRHLTIVGGTFCCNRSPAPGALLQVNSDAFKLRGASIYADQQGGASGGVVIGKGHTGCEIDATRFAHLPAGREIVADPGACRVGNNAVLP